MDARFNMFDNEILAKFGKRFANTSMVIGQSSLPKATQVLVTVGASQINGLRRACVRYEHQGGRCRGRNRSTPQLGRGVARGDRLHLRPSAPRGHSPRKEPASLTSYLGVSDETRPQVRKHYDDDQVAALVCLVALVNAANRMNVIVRNPVGSYEPGTFASMSN